MGKLRLSKAEYDAFFAASMAGRAKRKKLARLTRLAESPAYGPKRFQDASGGAIPLKESCTTIPPVFRPKKRKRPVYRSYSFLSWNKIVMPSRLPDLGLQLTMVINQKTITTKSYKIFVIFY